MNARILFVVLGLLAACEAPVQIGTDESAIFGGQPVKADDPIGKSGVFFTGISAMGHHGCSATVLDDSHALTAKHCWVGSAPRAPLPADAVLMFAVAYAPDAVTRPALEIFRRTQLNEDIAVVRFTGGLPPGYAPIPLAGSTRTSAGALVIHAGYGQTGWTVNDRGTLRATETRFSSSLPGRQWYETRLQGHSFCSGDSGGPDYVAVRGQLRQLGVHVTADCASFGRSTDVRPFTDWILSTGARPSIDLEAIDADL